MARTSGAGRTDSSSAGAAAARVDHERLGSQLALGGFRQRGFDLDRRRGRGLDRGRHLGHVRGAVGARRLRRGRVGRFVSALVVLVHRFYSPWVANGVGEPSAGGPTGRNTRIAPNIPRW